MLIHLHPDTKEALIRIDTDNTYFYIYNFFKEEKRNITLGKVEVQSCIESFCADCEYYFYNVDSDDDDTYTCEGGRDIIYDEDCEFYDPEDLYQEERQSVIIETPPLLFVNKVSRVEGVIIADYLYTVEEVTNSCIAVKPYQIGNVSGDGQICWGAASLSINQYDIDILRRWNEFWNSPFNEDYRTTLEDDIYLPIDYLLQYSKWHQKYNNIFDHKMDGKIYPLDLLSKSFIIFNQKVIPIKENDIVSLNYKDFMEIFFKIRKAEVIIDKYKNTLEGY